MCHPLDQVRPRSNYLGVRLAPLVAAFVMLLPLAAQGHAVLHEFVDGGTVTVRLSYADAAQPLFEPYEIFAPDTAAPFQSGRVNAVGEISFRPDRPGRWRVRVVTADGHGASITVDVDEAGGVASSAHGHASEYWLRVLAALGGLLGAFGALALWRARSARVSAG